ncbi:MAG TPA: hemolysin family protein [Thermoanaerobaculia bacterium]|nr:hemolysin family protein [Thermoanaerobaculia bacterium]
MGSSSPPLHLHWVVIAALCGILYLIFDAARSFAQQLSPVRLRRLGGDDDPSASRWTRYDARNLQLVTGALLQMSLIIAVGATIMVFDDQAINKAVLLAAAIWVPIVLLWKFALAVVPGDTGEVILEALIPFTNFFYFLFWPALFPLRRLVERIEERNDEEDDDDEEPTDAEVQAYIDVGEEEGILEKSEGKLLQSIVDFGDRLAHELMTPRIDVLAFDARRPIEDLARIFSESKYSRIPIYLESIDKITGIVHIKEIFDAILRNERKPVSELARPPYFVSETKKVSELLREFQVEHVQVAVVVDEFGGTAGIITIEDIVEDIVGDIADEHEDEEASIVDNGDGTYLVNGMLRVEALEELFPGADLSGDDYETVAGLIFTTLGRVPSAGTIVRKNGFRFDVDRVDRRRIYRVKVQRESLPPEEEEEG